MRDIKLVLERWSAWVRSENSGVDYSSVAAGFKGLLLQTSKPELSCSDDDGLIIDNCMGRLKKVKTSEYNLLIMHYLYKIPKRKIANQLKKDEKTVRIEILLAEGFISGCLSMLDMNLDMD